MKSWRETLVNQTDTIRTVIERLDNAKQQIVLVADENLKLLGVITDGIIRRAILSDVVLEDPCSTIMNPSPKCVAPGTSRQTSLKLMRENIFHHLPIVESDGKVCGLLSLDELVGMRTHEEPVLLMAGGRGRRLGEMTEQIPKPMLKVGNRPILESIVQNFVEQGFCKFFISVNYLSDQIEEYFGDGKQFGAEISYVHESQELGTAGAIGSISKDLSSNLIVMNGDILTAQNFGDVIDFHQIHNADATMVVRKWSQQIPFGVVNLDGEKIIDIAEKPVIQKFISAGIYVLSKVVTDLANQNERLDMPDLFARSKEKGLKLIAYEMDGYFTDVGRIDDFDRASRDWYQTTND